MWNDPEGAYDLAIFRQRDLHKAGSRGRAASFSRPLCWRPPAARLLRALADVIDPVGVGLQTERRPYQRRLEAR
jgi:hypothetical protein